MKKIISFLSALALLCMQVSAYNFPEPDWGALLKEKTDMVTATDFELFTEGPVTAAPYYGARLEPRGGAYLGTITENSDFLSPVGSYLTYFSMDDRQTDIYYPANEMIRSGNSVVTIGYTVNSLDAVDYDVIRKSLDNLASYNKPMFIRFANEMNVSALGDDPDYYVRVFRNVANMIHEYPNFAVVWSPNDLGALDRPFEYYYPGDEYVDWVGVSSYMKRYFGGNKNTAEKDAIYFMTGDYAWATNALKPILSFMEKNNIQKPVMLSECGVATENQYGEDCSSWASPRLRNLFYNVVMKYPQVKLINYFNTYRNEKERYYVSDPHNSAATDKPYAMYIMREAADSGAYIRSANGQPEFVYTPANEGYVLSSNEGVVNLYTLAYVPKTPYLEVNYYVDGVWYSKREAAPYKCSLELAGLADGEHSVKIAAAGMEKSYTFVKNGNAICFGDGLPNTSEPEPEPTPEPQPEPIPEPTPQPEPDTKEEIKVFVNGEPVEFDVPPVIVDDRTLVPLRAIFEALGADVEWNGAARTVSARKDATEIRLTIGENVMYVNQSAASLDVPARLIDDRTMVPIRAISEAFRCTVNWNGDEKIITIIG